MTFSDKTLTLLVLIALGVGLLGVLFAIFAAGGSRKRREPGGPIRLDDALRGVLDGQSKKIDRLEQAVRTLNKTDKQQQGLIEGSVRHVALLRYDAFEDVGDGFRSRAPCSTTTAPAWYSPPSTAARRRVSTPSPSRTEAALQPLLRGGGGDPAGAGRAGRGGGGR